MPKNSSESGRTQVVVCRLYPSQVSKLVRIARRLSPNVPVGHSVVLRWLVEHADEDLLKEMSRRPKVDHVVVPENEIGENSRGECI